MTTAAALTDAPWFSVGAALGIGLLIGLERERRKGHGPRRLAAGIRTFSIAALLGASALLVGGQPMVVAVALGIALFAAVAYWRSTADDPGVTTGVALVLTTVLGALAMTDTPLAVAIGVVIAGLLAGKPALHRFARELLTDAEWHDALVLAAATLVVLPLIPDRHLGPFDAFNPRLAWWLVILMMAVGALGHVGRRLLGPALGLPAAGLAGGFVSSVATIGTMGARARAEPAQRHAAVAGAVLSSLATAVQMVALLAAASPPLLRVLALPLAAAGAVALAYGAVFTWVSWRATPRAEAAERPADADGAFRLRTALLLAATISALTVLAAALQAGFGAAGLLLGAALAGFADTHGPAAAVASLVASGRLDAPAAALPVLAALSCNTVTKLVVAATAGGRAFAMQIGPGLAAMVAAAWAAWFWQHAAR